VRPGATEEREPELFDAYGRRDAEITLEMYRRFRAYIWERYRIDVLRRRSLAGTGCEIFLRHYLKASPAPAREKNLICHVRGSNNEWREQVRQAMVYNGPPELRTMAASAYAGGGQRRTSSAS